MRLQFNLVVKGNEALIKKFHQTIQTHPTFHMDLIQSFGQAVMLGLRLTKDDEISIESFKANQIHDDPISDFPVEDHCVDLAQNKVENKV